MNENMYPFRWTLSVGAISILLIIAWWAYPKVKMWVRLQRAKIDPSKNRQVPTRTEYQRIHSSYIRKMTVLGLCYLFHIAILIYLESGILKSVLNIFSWGLILIVLFFFDKLEEFIKKFFYTTPHMR